MVKENNWFIKKGESFFKRVLGNMKRILSLLNLGISFSFIFVMIR